MNVCMMYIYGQCMPAIKILLLLLRIEHNSGIVRYQINHGIDAVLSGMSSSDTMLVWKRTIIFLLSFSHCFQLNILQDD